MIFKDDMKEGEEKTFFESGKNEAICFYQNGKLHGKNIHWNEDQNVVFEGSYKDGLRHGKLNKYYPDGAICLEQNFINDKLHGDKKKHEKSGEIVISKYDNGVKVE